MTIFPSKEINKLFPLTAYMASRETESGGGQNHATTVFKNLYWNFEVKVNSGFNLKDGIYLIHFFWKQKSFLSFGIKYFCNYSKHFKKKIK